MLVDENDCRTISSGASHVIMNILRSCDLYIKCSHLTKTATLSTNWAGVDIRGVVIIEPTPHAGLVIFAGLEPLIAIACADRNMQHCTFPLVPLDESRFALPKAFLVLCIPFALLR